MEISTASTLQFNSLFNVIAIHPLPVPKSIISRLFLSKYLSIYLIVLLTSSSVSNLGIKTFLFTKILYP